MHLHRLKRKYVRLGAAGCGCLVMLSFGIGLILIARSTGIKNRVYGLCKSVWVGIPKQVRLPQEIKLPAELGLPDSIRLPQFPNLFTLSPQEQILLGQEVAQNQGFEAGAFVDARIDSAGMRLVRALPAEYRGPAESGGWSWQFRGLRTKDGSVNAVALPGGRIYLYDGLINLTGGDPDLLAAVIGHEIGHVVKEHTAKQLRTEGLLRKASELIVGNGGEGEGSQNQIIKTLAARLGQQVAQMQLSQAAEYQADSLAIQFMKAAKYNPEAFLDLLSKLNQIPVQRKGMLSGVFSTHPPTDRRIEEIRNLVKLPAEKAN